MKRLLLFTVVILSCICVKAQTNTETENICYPYMFSKDYAVVGVCAKTTDEELLNIRKDILKYTSIRFTNFDVIRGKDGDIYFLSMAVDCRDGYKGDISHAFEPGDTTYYGFIRDYTKQPNKVAFYMGNLNAETSCIKHVEQRVATLKEQEEKANEN
ncbi:MAG: hypothetical protein IJ180_05115 [Bacteroidales bacterium]|nr:hypothetical protein [Bacteroidales bacterium]